MDLPPNLPDLDVEIEPPLTDCFRHSEVDCVRECCGIDAISTNPAAIAAWSDGVGPAVAKMARQQLEDLIATVSDRSRIVSSEFLNHRTIDEAARRELLDFLGRFAAALGDVR